MNYWILFGLAALAFLIMFIYGEQRFDAGWKAAIKDLVMYKEGADSEN
jgi:hypothetical protein